MIRNTYIYIFLPARDQSREQVLRTALSTWLHCSAIMFYHRSIGCFLQVPAPGALLTYGSLSDLLEHLSLRLFDTELTLLDFSLLDSPASSPPEYLLWLSTPRRPLGGDDYVPPFTLDPWASAWCQLCDALQASCAWVQSSSSSSVVIEHIPEVAERV
uniref:hypothetical protein n=1 Tax=Thermogemmatispora sp. TaxID=1968838 RepID=UPI0035E41FA7